MSRKKVSGNIHCFVFWNGALERTEEPEEMFQSDFKIVADYFVQLRTNKKYEPSKEVMAHVDAVLKLMSVLAQDERFEEFQNSGEREVKTVKSFVGDDFDKACEVIRKNDIYAQVSDESIRKYWDEE